ncbi:protein FAR-RED IMPAIRED RESPONSE 1-like [Prosopis cineraria]|uniref:protein FAR-RED IMPAIRED RESPONSE 1-like n=1 Tax=Prosopis cineraria TaxID=364024 RepID=UPI002410813E|nr:protein FAR-RED IMPAIRED RESPONSE 1-like [Prosopis cineraria]
MSTESSADKMVSFNKWKDPNCWYRLMITVRSSRILSSIGWVGFCFLSPNFPVKLQRRTEMDNTIQNTKTEQENGRNCIETGQDDERNCIEIEEEEGIEGLMQAREEEEGRNGSLQPQQEKEGQRRDFMMEDELKPKIGREFGSWEEAWEFWQEYAKNTGFEPRKYNGTNSRKDGSLITYRYVCCKEGCRKEGKKETYSSKYRAETRTNCKARMIVSFIDQKYKITKFDEEHNHPLHTPATRHFLASQRNLSEVDAYGIDLARKSGLQQKATFDLMSTYAEVDTEEQITNVFWADAGMLIDYALFGEVVSLDTTYCTNCDHRPLAIFSGFNHYRSAVIFGVALLYDETTMSFKWLLETFLDAHMQKKPETVFTDQDQAMARALSEILPDTKHCLCTWHLKQNGIKYLGNLMKDGSHFLTDFCKCMSKISEEDKFEDAWSQLISSYDVHENTWLISMYKIKEKWAWCSVKNHRTLGMRSTQLSESVNADVKRCTTPGLAINEFFTTFDKVVAEKRDKELKLEFDSRQQILRQLVLTYTPDAFDMFQAQWISNSL